MPDGGMSAEIATGAGEALSGAASVVETGALDTASTQLATAIEGAQASAGPEGTLQGLADGSLIGSEVPDGSPDSENVPLEGNVTDDSAEGKRASTEASNDQQGIDQDAEGGPEGQAEASRSEEQGQEVQRNGEAVPQTEQPAQVEMQAAEQVNELTEKVNTLNQEVEKLKATQENLQAQIVDLLTATPDLISTLQDAEKKAPPEQKSKLSLLLNLLQLLISVVGGGMQKVASNETRGKEPQRQPVQNQSRQSVQPGRPSHPQPVTG